MCCPCCSFWLDLSGKSLHQRISAHSTLGHILIFILQKGKEDMAQWRIHANQFVFCCSCSDYNHNVQLKGVVKKVPFTVFYFWGSALDWLSAHRCKQMTVLHFVLHCALPAVCCTMCCTLCCKREAFIEVQQHNCWNFRRSEVSHLTCSVIFMLHFYCTQSVGKILCGNIWG